MLIGAVIILLTWEENYGDQVSHRQDWICRRAAY
jgi:hypothetical protein